MGFPRLGTSGPCANSSSDRQGMAEFVFSAKRELKLDGDTPSQKVQSPVQVAGRRAKRALLKWYPIVRARNQSHGEWPPCSDVTLQCSAAL